MVDADAVADVNVNVEVMGETMASKNEDTENGVDWHKINQSR